MQLGQDDDLGPVGLANTPGRLGLEYRKRPRTSARNPWSPRALLGRPRLLSYFFVLLSLCLNIYLLSRGLQNALDRRPISQSSSEADHVLFSYSYFEKDAIQKANAEFFIKVGMGINSTFSRDRQSDFVIVVNGDTCSPCEALYAGLQPDPLEKQFPTTLAHAWSSLDIALLWRTENEGMDFAAHNVTIEWVKKSGQYRKYRYFMFLNSSVRGPFVPSYMPTSWQWHQSFTERLRGDIAGVSSSLVCLPDIDAGGPGPKMESWAFALTKEGLELADQAGVFWLRKCKLCTGDDGIVVKGEYGLSTALLSAGYNIATLMSKYRTGTDWRDPEHWGCNNLVHPSRHGTYDHISMHPFETVFVKASWHVGQPHLDHYSNWLWEHAQGKAGTEGAFDERMYRYAISMQAQEPNFADECFKVLDDN